MADLQMLQELGANINQTDNFGNNAYLYAAINYFFTGNYENFLCLMEIGVDTKSVNNNGVEIPRYIQHSYFRILEKRRLLNKETIIIPLQYYFDFSSILDDQADLQNNKTREKKLKVDAECLINRYDKFIKPLNLKFCDLELGYY